MSITLSVRIKCFRINLIIKKQTFDRSTIIMSCLVQEISICCRHTKIKIVVKYTKKIFIFSPDKCLSHRVRLPTTVHFASTDKRSTANSLTEN